MDKLTLTRQFGIRFGIFLGRYREGIGTNISNRIGTGINICKIIFIEPSKAYVTFLSPVRKPHGGKKTIPIEKVLS